MKPTQETERVQEAVWGRRLTPSEVEALRRSVGGDPAAARRLEEELALNRILDAVPTPPVSSNFLAQVEARIARHEARTGPASAPVRYRLRWLSWRFWTTLLPVAVVALAFGAWWQVRVRDRALLATSVASLAPAGSIPGLESLQDFEAVRWLQAGPVPGDVELLAVLDAEPSSRLP